ncbi:MAG: hypothetical protein L0154_30520 [Chloroflexi bacterium]|nr:hypothetical protein [Chloroflexota bacterium]
MSSQPRTEQTTGQIKDDFVLNAAQMEFMINIDAAAEQADQEGNYDFFDDVVASEEWKSLFGDMSWDQAYDRYEIMIGRCTDC